MSAVKKYDFRNRFLSPVLMLVSVALGSWVAYNLAWRLNVPALHRFIALISGTLLFLSVAFGALLVYPVTYFRGAPARERVLASLFTPFLWATKECIRLSVSFSFQECLYYYVNPLNLWLLCGVCAQMALAEILCRQRRNRHPGESIRVLHPGVLALFLVSLSLAVGLYAWGEGENVYVIFLEGYRTLFGAGTGIPMLTK